MPNFSQYYAFYLSSYFCFFVLFPPCCSHAQVRDNTLRRDSYATNHAARNILLSLCEVLGTTLLEEIHTPITMLLGTSFYRTVK